MKYTIVIKAELTALNIESAQKKCDDIKEKVEKVGVEWSEVSLKGNESSKHKS